MPRFQAATGSIGRSGLEAFSPFDHPVSRFSTTRYPRLMGVRGFQAQIPDFGFPPGPYRLVARFCATASISRFSRVGPLGVGFGVGA
jgi:hypothetical protein